jgi:3-deoxy-manno-octulosonate cytidylyltransferase (CMP-KDO synthetase)
MKIAGIIPARYASTRFPGKPLALIHGKSMIQRVYEQVSKAKMISQVVVATDDRRIVDEVESFGGYVVMTAADHQSGTDRCAEALHKLNADFQAVINIQGDEPFIDPEHIDMLAAMFQNPNLEIASLATPIKSEEELTSPNVVKVVVGKSGKALYFSRSPIPFLRDKAVGNSLANHTFLKHVGIYAYRSQVLGQIVKLEQSALEKAESLEQLRWLENGFSIHIKSTESESFAVDTPEDLSKIINI